jgi:hypothetical protein
MTPHNIGLGYAWLFFRVDGQRRLLRIGPARTRIENRAIRADFKVPPALLGRRGDCVRCRYANDYGARGSDIPVDFCGFRGPWTADLALHVTTGLSA